MAAFTHPYYPSRCSQEYEVKYIHGDHTHYKTPQYYVKWKGYLPEESTWKPLSNQPNAQLAIQQYLEKKTRKEGPPGRKDPQEERTPRKKGPPGRKDPQEGRMCHE
ncbi:hypothetical protein DSO57_1000499 [Entomophthora muscae]|uniref:Uncharacterized protein n=1 Tax=Entomophthora muscae TaxID=34485 RepID=A0ACC2RP70_9FUNG|nr:hypothetical protein DSO57_1000499 [Entomophthora muscae]